MWEPRPNCSQWVLHLIHLKTYLHLDIHYDKLADQDYPIILIRLGWTLLLCYSPYTKYVLVAYNKFFYLSYSYDEVFKDLLNVEGRLLLEILQCDVTLLEDESEFHLLF